MKKLKRRELVKQILNETGVSSNTSTPAYFSRNQLLEILVSIRNGNRKIQSLTVGESQNVNRGTEKT